MNRIDRIHERRVRSARESFKDSFMKGIALAATFHMIFESKNFDLIPVYAVYMGAERYTRVGCDVWFI